MIVTTDIGNILYSDCKAFGIEDMRHKGQEQYASARYFDDFFSSEERNRGIRHEIAVILPGDMSTGTYWHKCHVNVNICVPDIPSTSNADLIRLNETEREAWRIFGEAGFVTGRYDGTTYRYSVSSSGIYRDDALKCHYVNTRLLFEALNTI